MFRKPEAAASETSAGNLVTANGFYFFFQSAQGPLAYLAQRQTLCIIRCPRMGPIPKFACPCVARVHPKTGHPIGKEELVCKMHAPRRLLLQRLDASEPLMALKKLKIGRVMQRLDWS